MYSWMHSLLGDHKGGIIFTCFGIWHILYLFLIFGAIIATVLCLRKRSERAKHIAVETAIILAFGLYMADFFLMPFAYGSINIEKLPFHVCTTMCILNFWSRHNKFLGKFKTQLALLGLMSNFIYVMYPAGVEWHQVHPLSYRVAQTLLFHGAMAAYGIFVLVFETETLRWRDCWKELVLIVIMTCWALVGNTFYNANTEEYSYFFNWFFVVQDPFGILPIQISPYIMPGLVITTFFVADMLVYGAYFGIRKCFAGRAVSTGTWIK